MRQERARTRRKTSSPQEQEQDPVVERDQQQQQQRNQAQAAPALFLCPISLEIMSDPVIVCTGQTYDRGSIEKWIRDGHRSCPITMLHLHDLTLIPNIIVRQLIEAWCSSEEPASAIFSASSASASPDLVLPELALPELDSPSSTATLGLELGLDLDLGRRDSVLALLRRIAKGQEVRHCVAALASLARDEQSGKVCCCIVEAGGALLMASMLADERDDAPCEEIMSLLAILCRGASREVIGAVLSESGALDCVVAHLASRGGKFTSRTTAALLLKRLLVTEEIRAELGRSRDFFPGLLDLLLSPPPPPGSGSPSSPRKGLLKLLHLACSHKPNRSRAVEEGAVDALASLLLAASASPASSSSSGWHEERGVDVGERALATMELLCSVEQGRRAVCDSSAAVHCAVRMLVGFSRQSTEHATACLLLVCQSGPVQALQIAMRAGARRQLLLLLQSDCTPRAKKKALELLKLFHAIFFADDEQASADLKSVDLY